MRALTPTQATGFAGCPETESGNPVLSLDFPGIPAFAGFVNGSEAATEAIAPVAAVFSIYESDEESSGAS